jgi:pilus assembly protein Flp/PilA
MKDMLKRFVREDEGQDLIEYALLIVFIAIVVIAALQILGPIVAAVYTNIGTELQS